MSHSDHPPSFTLPPPPPRDEPPPSFPSEQNDLEKPALSYAPFAPDATSKIAAPYAPYYSSPPPSTTAWQQPAQSQDPSAWAPKPSQQDPSAWAPKPAPMPQQLQFAYAPAAVAYALAPQGAPYAAPTSPLRSAFDGVREAVRIFAAAQLGLAILCMFAGGLSFVSSVLVVAQSGLWLTSSRTVAALTQLALAPRASGCCDCTQLGHLRSLAISGIVFGAIDLCVGLGFGVTVGAIINNNFFNEGEFTSQVFNPFVTLNNGVSGSFNAASNGLVVFSSFSWNNASWSPILGLGSWLFFAGGASLVASSLNIAMSAVTLQLVGLLRRIAASGPSPAAAPALPAFTLPTLAPPPPAPLAAVGGMAVGGDGFDGGKGADKALVSANPLAVLARAGDAATAPQLPGAV